MTADRKRGRFARLLTDPVALCCLIVLTLIGLAAAFAPVLTSASPSATSLIDAMGPAAPGHPLGYDGVGHDVLARLLYGARTSLLGSLLALAVAVGLGVPTGLIAGYYRGPFDTVMSWISDFLQAIPAIILLLVVLAAIGQNTYVAMGVFGVLMSTGVYRLIRSSVLAVREELYVDAARVSGLSDARIVRRHLLPVVVAPTVIQAAGMLGVGILIQSGLEFLGLGSTTEPSWGAMLNDAFANIYTKPILLLWPGAALVITVAALSLLGNSLSDLLTGGRPRPAPSRRPVVKDTVARPETTGALLVVDDLTVTYGGTTVVDAIGLSVRKGEVLGLVGESGSGKSQTAFAVLGLLPPEADVDAARMLFDGTDLTALTPARRNQLRGKRIGYVPQEPMSNLDPSFTIESQLTEPIRRHLGLTRAQARSRALELLDRVGIVDPQRVLNAYPHEISGGMAQRILIAGAVSCDPDLLIADEPTTALDVTVQAEVLDLLRSLQKERDMGLVLVTHDFGVVADICDTIAVMQTGRIVERADAATLFADPQHEYTRMLLGSTLHGTPARPPLGTVSTGAHR